MNGDMCDCYFIPMDTEDGRLVSGAREQGLEGLRTPEPCNEFPGWLRCCWQ